MYQNYYEVLGVSEGSKIDEIRDIYKKLCLIYHPDKNPSTAAQQKFLEIQTGKISNDKSLILVSYMVFYKQHMKL